jgi:2-C-methyl-D-erythritol 4-phosphate cytidylyltransferase
MSAAIDLVFLCAGRGTRVGLDLPKQFLDLGGKPVMVHALEVYDCVPFVGRKIIVHDPVDANRITEIIQDAGISNCVLTPGGATRQESVRRGIACAATQRVLTHNAAVPFLNEEMIERALAVDADCVSTATEVKDSLVRVDGGDLLPIPRAGLRIVNSPQAFKTAALHEAHESALAAGKLFTSDTELMLHFGKSVRLVSGPSWSFKITDRVDLALAETILARPDLFPSLLACR